MCGNLYASLVSFDKCGRSSVPACVAEMVLPLGSITVGPLLIGCSSINGMSIAT